MPIPKTRRTPIIRARPMPAAVAAAAALCLIAALAPAAAQAKRTLAPPGNSGVEQYLEVVPGPEGNVPVGSSPSRHGVLPKSTRQRLAALGAEGRAAAAFAESTGVTHARHARSRRHAGSHRPTGHRRRHSGAAGSGGGGPPAGEAGSAPAGSVVTPGGGIGLGLPLALAVIALLALAAGVLMRRRSAR